MAAFPWVTSLAFLRSGLRKEEDGNDLQVHFVSLVAHDDELSTKNFGTEVRSDRPITDLSRAPTHGVTILPSLILPHSRGTVKLNSADPSVYPAIDPRYFEADVDMQQMVEAYKFVRKVASTGPLSEVLDAEKIDESIPHPPESEAYMREHIARSAVTIYPRFTTQLALQGWGLRETRRQWWVQL